MVTETKVFAARDINGDLFFYTTKPKMREDGTFIGGGVVSDKGFMPFIAKGQLKECVITAEVEDGQE